MMGLYDSYVDPPLQEGLHPMKLELRKCRRDSVSYPKSGCRVQLLQQLPGPRPPAPCTALGSGRTPSRCQTRTTAHPTRSLHRYITNYRNVEPHVSI